MESKPAAIMVGRVGITWLSSRDLMKFRPSTISSSLYWHSLFSTQACRTWTQGRRSSGSCGHTDRWPEDSNHRPASPGRPCRRRSDHHKRWEPLDAGLLEGVHVPVEDTAGHRDGHCLQAVGNDAAFLAVSLHWLRSMTSLYSRRSTNLSPVGLYWYSQFQLTCMTSEPDRQPVRWTASPPSRTMRRRWGKR